MSTKTYRAKVGGNLSDGTRFEAGEIVEAKAADIKALLEMDAVEETEDDS